MFEYEMQKMRRDDLIREAEADRLARQVRKARRAAARSATHDGKGPVRTHRGWFTRAA